MLYCPIIFFFKWFDIYIYKYTNTYYHILLHGSTPDHILFNIIVSGVLIILHQIFMIWYDNNMIIRYCNLQIISYQITFSHGQESSESDDSEESEAGCEKKKSFHAEENGNMVISWWFHGDLMGFNGDLMVI